MTSTRLPGKVLLPLGGEPILDWVAGRLSRCRSLDEVVIATTTDAEDDPLAEHCRRRGYRFSRGSRDDVLSRYLVAAAEAGAGVVVRVTSDCPFVDPATVDRVVGALGEGESDYVNILADGAHPRSLPRGLNCEALSAATLERADRAASQASHREHVTQVVWQSSEFTRKTLWAPPEQALPDRRLTVDTPEDYRALRALVDRYRLGPEASLNELLACCRDSPDLHRINAHVRQKAA